MPGQQVPIEQADIPVRVERMGGVSWRLPAAIGLVVALITIAVVKPWGMSPHSPASVDRASALAGANAGSGELASPAATNDPEVEAALRRKLCDAPTHWRLVTVEVTALGDSRTMYGATPAEASGPADRSIPTAHLAAIRLYAIGLCRPNASGRLSVDTPFEGVTLWQIRAGGEPARIVGFLTLDQELFRLGEGYFGPPPAEPGSGPATEFPPVWQPGRYVFQIDRGGDAGQSLWVALDFSNPESAAVPTSRPTDLPGGDNLSR